MNGPGPCLFVGGPRAGQAVSFYGVAYKVALRQPVSASVREYIEDMPDPTAPVPLTTFNYTKRMIAFDEDIYWLLAPEDWSDREAFAHLMVGNQRTHMEPAE